MPRVSVVMSVYNGARYVGEAVDSILAQTYDDFEFIIIDDGSTDDTGRKLDGFHDSRIVRLKNERNLGLTKSLNRGLRLARGEYIARLDADDVALPQRLEKQVQFLDAHPQVGLVGSTVIYISPQGQTLGEQVIRERDVREALLDMRFCWEHSSTTFRSACVEAVGPYREVFRYSQDYDLWLRIAEQFGIEILDQPLVKLRLHSASISIEKRIQQRAYVVLALALAGQRWLTGTDNPQSFLNGSNTPTDAPIFRFAPREVTRAYLRDICLHYLLGDVFTAQSTLREALQETTSFLEDPAWVMHWIVSYGVNHAVTPGSWSGAVQFVRRIFDNLPPEAEALARLKRKALGHVHAAWAFEAHQQRDYPLVRREVLLAVWHNPAWLLNKGLGAIFFRSLTDVRRLSTRLRPSRGMT